MKQDPFLKSPTKARRAKRILKKPTKLPTHLQATQPNPEAPIIKHIRKAHHKLRAPSLVPGIYPRGASWFGTPSHEQPNISTKTAHLWSYQRKSFALSSHLVLACQDNQRQASLAVIEMWTYFLYPSKAKLCVLACQDNQAKLRFALKQIQTYFIIDRERGFASFVIR